MEGYLQLLGMADTVVQHIDLRREAWGRCWDNHGQAPPPLPTPSVASLGPSREGRHLIFLLLQLLHQVKLLRLQLMDPVGQFLSLVPGKAEGLSWNGARPHPRLRKVEGTLQSHTADL